MEAINRIKIRIGDNKCIIQPEANCKETISNSMSLNISKSEDEREQNDNGEISMQSIFLSEKKTLTLSGILNESLIHHQKDGSSFKPENNNKPVLKQLNFNSKNTNPFCSAISLNKNSAGISIKNTTVSSSKATSITSFKNASNINTNTSPFNSNISNKSNSHSYSNSFIEKGAFLSMNKISQGQQAKNSNTNNPIKRDYIETIITKIIKQRSLSSRGSRPTTSLLPASLSHRLLHITQTNITHKKRKSYSCSKQPLCCSKQNLAQFQIQNEDKKRLQYSSSLSSSLQLSKKGKDLNQSNKESNYSLVNFIIKNCLKRSSINSRANKCQTSRSMISVPPGQKRKTSPKPPQVIFNNNINKDMVKIEKKTENNKKQVQTISNFSKYIRKSQTTRNQFDKQKNKGVKYHQQSKLSFNKGEVIMKNNKAVHSNIIRNNKEKDE